MMRSCSMLACSLVMPTAVFGGLRNAESLRGIKTVSVLVEDLHPAMEQAGVMKSQLTTDVELKLRLAGIRIVTAEESFLEPGQPYVYARVTGGSTFFAVELHLEQNVVLQRDSHMWVSGASTWMIVVAGSASRPTIADEVRKALSIELDHFINEYLSVNPK